MDAREITRRDLGTSAQVTEDAQMLFLQHSVSLRASHLNYFSAVSRKPLLKCFQEPGIEFLPATPYGPCNMPHLQLLTVEKSHLYSEIWCFHNCSFRQPMREMFGSSCSSKTTFFSTIIFGRRRQKHSISAHEGKNVKLGPSWEFPYCLVRRVSYFIHSFTHAAFQYHQWILPSEFGLFFFNFFLFHFSFYFPEGHLFSPMEVRGVCSPRVGEHKGIFWS